MKIEEVFKMGMKNPEEFDNEIINCLVNKYECTRQMAKIRLKDCLAYGWALITNLKDEVIGIETNYDRSEIRIGK